MIQLNTLLLNFIIINDHDWLLQSVRTYVCLRVSCLMYQVSILSYVPVRTYERICVWNMESFFSKF